MSDKPIDLGEVEVAQAPIPYEPPTVSPLGNVRDLLAGNNGTQPDGTDPDFPTQP
jgi:hypothetical protein